MDGAFRRSRASVLTEHCVDQEVSVRLRAESLGVSVFVSGQHSSSYVLSLACSSALVTVVTINCNVNNLAVLVSCCKL